MAQTSRKSVPLSLVAVSVLLLAAIFIALRQPAASDANSGQTKDHATVTGGSTESKTRSSRDRDAGPHRGRMAPSISASDEVAALVGNQSLSDAEVISGLREIIDDPKRPIDERTEALEHVINLVPDQEPSALLEIAADARQPNPLMEMILAESLNRPQRLQAELLIRLLGHSSGAMQEEIREELESLVGEDLGSNPSAWRSAIDALRDDP